VIIIPNLQLIEDLSAIVATLWSGEGQKWVVHLAVAPFSPSVTSTPASFTEAAFTGYESENVTSFGTPHIGNNGQVLVEPTVLAAFNATGTLETPVTILGYWVEDEAGVLVLAEVFATPFQMVGAGTPLSFTLGFALQAGSFSTAILP
jgi:hypothetical protein